MSGLDLPNNIIVEKLLGDGEGYRDLALSLVSLDHATSQSQLMLLHYLDTFIAAAAVAAQMVMVNGKNSN